MLTMTEKCKIICCKDIVEMHFYICQCFNACQIGRIQSNVIP
uniref:Uncharacterized protein n=1 Tax=Anguilla anguilla TaxID=7936 RepID=A0A0E9QMK4_ANGAN